MLRVRNKKKLNFFPPKFNLEKRMVWYYMIDIILYGRNDRGTKTHNQQLTGYDASSRNIIGQLNHGW